MIALPAGRPARRARPPALALAGAALLLTAFPPPAAQAHAILMESQPAVQGTVPPGALPVALRFNSRIDAARSRLLLMRAADRSQAPLPLEPTEAPDRLLSHAELPAGEYVLRWQVLAVDGHITRGDVPFRVAAP